MAITGFTQLGWKQMMTLMTNEMIYLSVVTEMEHKHETGILILLSWHKQAFISQLISLLAVIGYQSVNQSYALTPAVGSCGCRNESPIW